MNIRFLAFLVMVFGAINCGQYSSGPNPEARPIMDTDGTSSKCQSSFYSVDDTIDIGIFRGICDSCDYLGVPFIGIIPRSLLDARVENNLILISYSICFKSKNVSVLFGASVSPFVEIKEDSIHGYPFGDIKGCPKIEQGPIDWRDSSLITSFWGNTSQEFKKLAREIDSIEFQNYSVCNKIEIRNDSLMHYYFEEWDSEGPPEKFSEWSKKALKITFSHCWKENKIVLEYLDKTATIFLERTEKKGR